MFTPLGVAEPHVGVLLAGRGRGALGPAGIDGFQVLSEGVRDDHVIVAVDALALVLRLHVGVRLPGSRAPGR